MRKYLILTTAALIAVSTAPGLIAQPSERDLAAEIFGFSEDSDPLTVRDELLDVLYSGDEADYDGLWYLLLGHGYDDPDIRYMLALSGVSTPPEVPHPLDARDELLDLVSDADDDEIRELQAVLLGFLQDPEIQGLLAWTSPAAATTDASDRMELVASAQTNQKKNPRIGPGPNNGNYDPNSRKCWDRVPQISPGPTAPGSAFPGPVMYPRRDMQNYCKSGIIKRGKCKVYKTLYERDSRKRGNPCSFK